MLNLARKNLPALAAAASAALILLSAGQASAQPYYYPEGSMAGPPRYSRPYYPPQPYYPPARPPVYVEPEVEYYPRQPRVSRYTTANHCATEMGTCQTAGPMRVGRGCNCFFPGYGKVPGQAVP